MKAKFALWFATSAALPALLCVPAAAQALLSPYEITTSIQQMGLQPLSYPVQRGARYIIRAVDGQGMEVRVAADGISGRILTVRPVGDGRRPVYADRYATPYYEPEQEAPARGSYQPPQGPYERQGSYQQPEADPRSYGWSQERSDQQRYDQRGNYDRQATGNPADAPPVIYAPRDGKNAAQPPRAPTAAKPIAPKMAAKPPASKAAERAEKANDAAARDVTPKPEAAKDAAPKQDANAAAKPEPKAPERKAEVSAPASTTGAAAPLKPASTDNAALKAPPVQAFD